MKEEAKAVSRLGSIECSVVYQATIRSTLIASILVKWRVDFVVGELASHSEAYELVNSVTICMC